MSPTATDNGTVDHETALKVVRSHYASLDQASRDAFISRLNMTAMAEADPEVFEPPVKCLDDYLAWELPQLPELVSGHTFVSGGITVTVARAGRGKTSCALNRLLRWGAGLPWLPGWTDTAGEPYMSPARPLRCLIIENEGAAAMFQQQLQLMRAGAGFSDAENRLVGENVMVWGDGGWSGLKLDNERNLEMVRQGIDKHKPDIVLIEPFRGLWSGEENSATDMAVVADALSGIASDYGTAVWLTHHERKAGAGEDGEKMSAGRGSTVLEGVAATMENFESVSNGAARELSWSKIRYAQAAAPAPVRVQWDWDTRWYSHVSEDALLTKFLDALAAQEPEPMTLRELMEATGEKEKPTRTTLGKLVKADRVVKLGSMPNGPGGGSTGNRYRLKTGTAAAPGVDF